MTIIRVGVQAPSTSTGQSIDFDDGPLATSIVMTNVSGESVQYSTDGGVNFTTIAAGATASIGQVTSDQFRMRRATAGGYVVPVNVDVTAQDGLTRAQVAATAALVSGGGIGAPLLVFNFGQDSSITSDNTATDAAGRNIPNYSFVLPGGSMGPNGKLRIELIATVAHLVAGAAPANNAFLSLRIGATTITALATYAWVTGQTQTARWFLSFDNTAVGANRFFQSGGSGAVSTSGMSTTAIDTSVDQTVNLVGTWQSATAATVMTVRSMTARVEYGA